MIGIELMVEAAKAHEAGNWVLKAQFLEQVLKSFHELNFENYTAAAYSNLFALYEALISTYKELNNTERARQLSWELNRAKIKYNSEMQRTPDVMDLESSIGRIVVDDKSDKLLEIIPVFQYRNSEEFRNVLHIILNNIVDTTEIKNITVQFIKSESEAGSLVCVVSGGAGMTEENRQTIQKQFLAALIPHCTPHCTQILQEKYPFLAEEITENSEESFGDEYEEYDEYSTEEPNEIPIDAQPVESEVKLQMPTTSYCNITANSAAESTHKPTNPVVLDAYSAAIKKLESHSWISKTVIASLNRLKQGQENNWNPYWMNSGKKLERILRAIENLDVDVKKGIEDEKSELFTALNMQRISRFTLFGKLRLNQAKTAILIKEENSRLIATQV